ncbi:MAG: hypothetical protein U0K83_07450 [Bacteroidales bacterium]|nr:hypothetical protein [Bacteroidales bacterium]
MLLLIILVIVLVVIIITQNNKKTNTQSIENKNECSENVIVEGDAPYSIYALILGIVSCFTSVFFIGLIFGIIGLVYANKGLNLYNEYPQRYMSKSKLEIGKITSVIGIIIAGVMLLVFLIAALSMPSFH